MKMKKITTYHIAQELGVSQATVSRALNNDPRITSAVRKVIQEKASEMGYVCNRVAKSLITGRSGTIGVLNSALAHDISGARIVALDDEIRLHGLHTYIANTLSESIRTADMAMSLYASGVDGLIIFVDSIMLNSPEDFERLLKINRPLVLVSKTRLPYQCHQVVESQGYAVDEMFSTLRHEKLRRLRGYWPVHPADDDYNYQKLVEEIISSGGDPEQDILRIARGFSHPTLSDKAENICRSQAEALDKFIASFPPEPVALICHNDMIALQAQCAAQRRGVCIPNELLVVGYNNSSASVYAVPPLSTIEVPVREIAAAAFRLLQKQIDNVDDEELLVEVNCRFLRRNF